MTLEDRIVRLERQNRWMKRVGGVAVVLAGLFLTLGQSKPPDEVSASKFTLVDEKGEGKGAWALHDGEPVFTMHGKGGDRVGLTTSTIVLYRAKDKGRILLSTETELEGPMIAVMFDHATPKTALMRVSAKEGPSVHLESDSGVAHMSVSPTLGSVLVLGTGSGGAKAKLNVHDDGAGFLLESKSGIVGLGMNGKAGSVSIGILPATGPGLEITSPTKKILFKAP